MATQQLTCPNGHTVEVDENDSTAYCPGCGETRAIERLAGIDKLSDAALDAHILNMERQLHAAADANAEVLKVRLDKAHAERSRRGNQPRLSERMGFEKTEADPDDN